MPEPKEDPIAPFARAILELFREDLRSVRFPDLDHDSLLTATEELSAAQLEVECIEAALSAARELVRERGRALTAHAARGLAYARIFAHGNLALGARITQIELLLPDSANTAPSPGKKRGRPRKESSDPELFARESSEGGTEEEVAA